MPDQNNAFTALTTNTNSALDDRADGHTFGILKNLRRDGIVGTLSLLHDVRGIMDSFLHVGGAEEKGGSE